MGRGSTKGNENVYFVARKRAAMYNERLYSREGAAELLGISVSTLADYELGNTKVVPVDKVVLMADLYNAPELKTGYCKHECPICSYLPVATEVKVLEGITLRLMKRLDCDELNRIKKELVDITEDGIIDETEKPELKKILAFLDEVAESISELKIVGEKYLKKV
jgi:transcriptional regulator with XRE-family HTH domain